MDVLIVVIFWFAVGVGAIGFVYHARSIWRMPQFQVVGNAYQKFLFILSVLSPLAIAILSILNQVAYFEYQNPCEQSTTFQEALAVFVVRWTPVVLSFFLVLPPILLLLVFTLWIFAKDERKYIYRRSLFFVVVGIIAAVLVSSIIFATNVTPKRKAYDARRIANIMSLRKPLYSYAVDHDNKFPVLEHGDVTARWDQLSQILVPKYISELPHDPCAGREADSQFQYEYKSNSDGSNFVLRAFLVNKNNNMPKDDVDGDILGVWCGEGADQHEFCMTEQ